MIDHKRKGKLNRAAGKRFELKVREDLEKNGWIVFRNSNDVVFPESNINLPPLERIGMFKQTTGHWNPGTHSIMMSQSGFPDFLVLKRYTCGGEGWAVQFVECKGGDEKHKYLSAIEKDKVNWIKENLKICVLLANKGKKRGEIKYEQL